MGLEEPMADLHTLVRQYHRLHHPQSHTKNLDRILTTYTMETVIPEIQHMMTYCHHRENVEWHLRLPQADGSHPRHPPIQEE